MLCAEEGDGAEARGGRTPQPGSAHSSAGVLLPHPSWLKRFHAPPPPYPRNRCIHPSPPPPPFALCSSVSPLGVFRGAEDIQLLPGHCWTAAPRTPRQGGGGPRVPPLPHCCSSAATRDRGSVLFCTSWPSPLYFPPPPLVLLWGAVDGSVDPQRGPPGGV